MTNEPWYEIVDANRSITQGDLIFNCPLLEWNPEKLIVQESNEVEILKGAADAISADVVVMSQACDLEHEKIKNAILCPHMSIQDYKKFWRSDVEDRDQNPTDRAWRSHCNDICDGYIWNLSMLNHFTNNNDLRLDIRLVDFHEVFSIPRSFLESLLSQRGKQRFRLLPPYREHLSQAFARFFMRVGLPIPIEKDWSLI